MAKYTIIAENDESQWDDVTGEVYHFPSRYLKHLEPGTKVIYYKGKMRDRYYEDRRLSPDPHYFGIAEIGEVSPDLTSTKRDYFANIVGFQMFNRAVGIRHNDELLEQIPPNRESNYWRDGVREIDEEIYDKIVNLSELSETDANLHLNDNDQGSDEALTSTEGAKKSRYTTVYERDQRLRRMAIKIHGLSCVACGFNFERHYGEWGKGFVHVHHIKPVSETGETVVNPKTDLTVLCANCHSMVHRKKSVTLTVEDLKKRLR